MFKFIRRKTVTSVHSAMGLMNVVSVVAITIDMEENVNVMLKLQIKLQMILDVICKYICKKYTIMKEVIIFGIIKMCET